RWRDSSDDWDEDVDVAALADDQVRVGALDESRTEHSDLYDFDEPAPSVSTRAVSDTEAAEPVAEPAPAARIRTRTRPVKEPRVQKDRSRGGEGPPSDEADLPVRILTGVAIVI